MFEVLVMEKSTGKFLGGIESNAATLDAAFDEAMKWGKKTFPNKEIIVKENTPAPVVVFE